MGLRLRTRALDLPSARIPVSTPRFVSPRRILSRATVAISGRPRTFGFELHRIGTVDKVTNDEAALPSEQLGDIENGAS
jgi:hypothetical protein